MGRVSRVVAVLAAVGMLFSGGGLASAAESAGPAPGGASQCVPDRSTIAQCFPDEALARSIAEELGADNTDEVLTSEDVNNTTRLWVRDPTVASVQGLQVFTNLESLNLSYAGVYSTGFSDVSPLAKLTKLEELDLSHTAVSDVSPLAGLTKLRRLSLSTTPVSDVSPLAKLTNLQELNLSSAWGYSNSTGLSDVSPLAKLTKLEELDLSHTAVSDVSPLAKLTKLHFLGLSGTGVLDLGVLRGLPLRSGSADEDTSSFAGVRPSAGLTADGDGSVSMPAPRWLDGTVVAPSSTSPAGGVLDAKRGVVTWKKYDAGASYSYDFKQSFALKTKDGSGQNAVEFSGHVTGVEPKTFVVSFDSAGGSSVASQTVEYGARVAAPKDPVRAGYAFQGWYTAKSGGSKYDFGKPVTGGLTLYARWKANVYTLSFDANGGSVSPGSKSVAYGGAYGQLPAPSRKGYTFQGWYTAKSGGSKIGVDTVAAGNATVYAHWAANSYRVTFDADGGSVQTAGKTVTQDRPYGTLPTPARAGHTFGGWYTAKSGGTKITASTVFTAGAAQTLFAHWDAVVFRDVSSSTPHASDIAWLADAGVSTGWREPDGSYSFRGMDSVKRQDMAAFLRREAKRLGVKDAASWKPSDEDWKQFRDVSPSTPHAEDVLWLAHANVSTGWPEPDGSRTFRGMDPVRRQDMAAFLYRLAVKAGRGGGVRPGSFRDVSDATPHASEVRWLGGSGVSTGYADGTFRGMLPVYRQDMAAFLHRFDGLK